MKLRLGLASKFSLLTVANLIVLAALLAVFVRLQLSADMKSFVMTAARERILAVSRELALDLERTEPAERNALLERFSQTHGVEFHLFLNTGKQLAGPEVRLPDPVAQRLHGRQGQRPGDAPPGVTGPPNEEPPDRPVELDQPPPEERPDADPNRPRMPRGGRLGGPPGDIFLVETVGSPAYWVGVRVPAQEAPGEPPQPATLILSSRSLWFNSFYFQLWPWIALAAAAVIFSVLFWFPFVFGLTRSIHRMMDATARLASGRFDVDATVHRDDELGSLGNSINRMAAQLDAQVRGQKRFLADAAHELRSPLARMQFAAGIMERTASAAEAQYLTDLREDLEVMTQLTDELLTYARAETKQAIRLQPVALLPLVEKAVRLERRAGAEILVDVPVELHVIGEENLLCRSVANLLRNAIRYAADSGPIVVSAKAVNGSVSLVVYDSGPGMPRDALRKVFTPFFRLDESRDRRTGGAGLGLSIVKSCVEACGGSVACNNREPAGFEVTMQLKRAA